MSTVPFEPTVRWTIADLEGFALEEGKRYEIVEGELFVSTQPHWNHQEACNNIAFHVEDELTSPLLPGFTAPVARLFPG
jgi:hypothetical protein